MSIKGLGLVRIPCYHLKSSDYNFYSMLHTLRRVFRVVFGSEMIYPLRSAWAVLGCFWLNFLTFTILKLSHFFLSDSWFAGTYYSDLINC